MIKGMRRIHLLIRMIILVACFAAQGHHALAATVHVIPGKGVSNVLANEFGSITTQVMQFYQEVYEFAPANSISIVIVADEPHYIQRLQFEGYSIEQATRIAKVSSGLFRNSKLIDSPSSSAVYTASASKLQYTNPVIIICANKNTNYLSRSCTITHEMFHYMQQELQGNTPGHAWLIEGSASISEYVLLEWLGKGSLASHRHSLVNSIINIKLKADPDDLKNGGSKWIKLMEQHMYPYEVSESMTEYLMCQVGKPPIVRYFALIGKTHNRNIAFQKAFGRSYTQFIDDYKAYMKQEAVITGRIKIKGEGWVAPGFGLTN